ncbi:MAG TPA: DUF5058 family protein [Candidatus Lachnoclostridium stercoripullorum]|uniref:DUF5058 family protein n=1 Tax=Candidatus Lachnoclostridium stercoripullorum TaxID=2838635 RepID=A0A9D1W4I7_9FIRM|nr:DUF5058 family protein [Candidatus Lachnoclostridium stercoripullorum]
MTFLEIMNSPLLYGLVGAGILYILIFCAVTFRKAYRHALDIGMSKEKLRTVIVSSAIYTIVPSISIVIGLFSLSTVIGVPWSWFRLSVVGAVTYELMAADMAATGAGYESVAALSSIGDPSVAGTLMFVMSIGILGGMLGVLKARSKNGMIGALLTGVLSLAIIEAFLPMQLIKGPVFCAVALTSCLATVAQMMLVKKFKILWYRNFIMAVTLIVGMASSLIWIQVLG